MLLCIQFFAEDVSSAVMERLQRGQLACILPIMRFVMMQTGWNRKVNTRFEANILARAVLGMHLVRWDLKGP